MKPLEIYHWALRKSQEPSWERCGEEKERWQTTVNLLFRKALNSLGPKVQEVRDVKLEMTQEKPKRIKDVKKIKNMKTVKTVKDVKSEIHQQLKKTKSLQAWQGIRLQHWDHGLMEVDTFFHNIEISLGTR